MLSEHPEIEKRLRQEIFDKVGRTGRPTYDQMRELKFMRAFINGMLYNSQLALTKKPVVDDLYGRGTKTLSSGVSFFLSISF